VKQLKLILPAVLLIASLAFIFSCNQSDDRAVTGSMELSQFVPAGLEVVIDIQPHNPSSRVNCVGANRVISVGIMSEDGFDATLVDHATVVFEGATECHIDPETNEPLRYEIDVDEDGDKDLVLHFLLKETYLNCDSEEACLEGETFGSVSIWGCDEIKMFRRP